MRILVAGLFALVLAVAANQAPAVAAAGSCSDLAKLALPRATITMAAPVQAGAFRPDAPGNADDFAALPAFCRVAATLKPTSDSDIKIEVWLPASGWNGKFQAVGNGGFSGAIAYPAMARALARGYAAASTDTGHAGSSASFALGHPEKLVDFGWRAVHEMTVASKKVVAAHYGAAPKFSYFNGCSAGGRQGMAEAQRFPDDFDGIIAGAPGLDWTGRASQAVRIAQALDQNPASRLLQPQRQLLHRAVVEACDALDGVKDGLLENPMRCTFDPAVLQCSGAANTAPSTQPAPQAEPTSLRAGCLSAPQVEAARLIYSGVKNHKTGREIGGLLPGSELGWSDSGWTAGAGATGLDQFRFLVFANPAWTVQQFKADADVARAEEVDGNTVNALDPNVKPFIDRGGKLIQYHGWSVPADYSGRQRAVPRARRRSERRCRQGACVVPALSRARDGALRRRPGPEHVRHGHRSRAVGRGGQGPGPDHRVACDRRTRRSDAPSLPFPAGRRLQGQREHRRGRKLLVSGGIPERVGGPPHA